MRIEFDGWRHSFAICAAGVALTCAGFTGCSGDSSGSRSEADTGWRADTRTGGSGGGTDTSAVADGGGVDTGETVRDTGEPEPADAGLPDSGVDPGPDAAGPGLTAAQITSEPWYGMFRVTQQPHPTGSMQQVTFGSDQTVQIGFQAAVTGEWRIFDDDSILLYNLEQADGSPNNPEQFPVEAELEEGWLVGLELFIPQGPDGEPYTIRYEHLEMPDVAYGDITGEWQSKEIFTDRQDREFRIVLRVESSGQLGYGVYTGNYFEVSRGEGKIISYDTGESMWFILPPSGSSNQPPLGGTVETSGSGDPVLWAPRGIDEDGMDGPDTFEAVEMERVQSPSL